MVGWIVAAGQHNRTNRQVQIVPEKGFNWIDENKSSTSFFLIFEKLSPYCLAVLPKVIPACKYVNPWTRSRASICFRPSTVLSYASSSLSPAENYFLYSFELLVEFRQPTWHFRCYAWSNWIFIIKNKHAVKLQPNLWWWLAMKRCTWLTHLTEVFICKFKRNE